MWQRVQTLYLAISTILIGALFFCVKATAFDADAAGPAVLKYTDYIPYLVLLIIISLLNVLALTTFKHRIFQMRTAVLAAIVTIALQIWLGVDFWMTHGEYIFKLTAVFPILCVILDFLAARGILADQLLVESAYPLRKSRRDRRK